MAGLFYLQINLLFILYNEFWDTIKDIILLNCFSGILKQKHITKANSVNFHHSDNFLYMLVEVLTIALYIHIAS